MTDRIVVVTLDAHEVDDVTEAVVDLLGDGRGALVVAPADPAAARAASAAAHRTGADLAVPDPATGRLRRQAPTDAVLDDLHRDEAEPWDVDGRWYEQRKRDLVAALLPRRRFAHGLEVGCSTGALAAVLAARCERLTAIDGSEHALARARPRLAGVDHVELRTGDVPDDWPEGRFDLVVCSEVGYFLSPSALERFAERVVATRTPDGVVVLAHWRHEMRGWPLDGPAVHRRLTDLVAPAGLTVQAVYRDADVEMLLLGPPGSTPPPDA
ncbi:class I SAM-dependent DNA methyltransferase [Nocardioides marinquilinus]|uniref:class I SAM-dependent DNA methyltransferase n=1 Tax=Nocardioides marinquilinus TaxID=1210400 RepID=UPI0031ED5933